MAGFGWLARISVGFLDRSGLDLARLRLDFGFWLSFTRRLVGCGLISEGFRLDLV